MLELMLTAVIMGLFGFIGTLVALYHREILYLFHRSRRDLTGSWIGTGQDISVPDVLPHRQSFDSQLSGKITQHGSHITFTGKSVTKRTNEVKGRGRIQGDYVMLDYFSVSQHAEQFGVGVLYLLGTGEAMQGFLVGKRLREPGLSLIHVQVKRVT